MSPRGFRLANRSHAFAVIGALGLIASGCLMSATSEDGDSYDDYEAAICSGAAPWSSGKAYSVGAVVSYQGKSYRCQIAHTSQAGWSPTLAPALWQEGASCGGSGGGTGGGSTGGTTGCNYPAWQQGASYHTGDIVIYKGSPYIAEHDNPGYDPTISTWFWDPYAGCSGGGSSGGATGGSSGGSGTCDYPAWQQGASYHTGDIVIYKGSPYIAEHDNPGYDPTISTWFWDPYAGCSGGGGSSGSGGGGSVGGAAFGGILSESVFNTMFPGRNGFYTYQALANAAATFPSVGGTGDTDTRKREVAAFLANIGHETGGLVYTEEINKAPYCDTSWGPPGCSCAPGKWYFGRGPMQLSWNGNYCAAGAALGLDLQGNPELVSQDATVAWRTAFWFWTTQTGAGSMTAHNAMTQGSGFGETIRTINGALECNGGNPGQVQSRVDLYTQFTNLLGVSPGNNTGC